MTSLKFKVDRKRPEDGGEQIVECVVPMEESRAKLISYEFDLDDPEGESKCEKEYNKFCDEVWKYVRDQHNLDTGCDWYFYQSPEVVNLEVS